MFYQFERLLDMMTNYDISLFVIYLESSIYFPRRLTKILLYPFDFT